VDLAVERADPRQIGLGEPHRAEPAAIHQPLQLGNGGRVQVQPRPVLPHTRRAGRHRPDRESEQHQDRDHPQNPHTAPNRVRRDGVNRAVNRARRACPPARRTGRRGHRPGPARRPR
jgi:hypothetical protein